jgi:hypothetical protein
MRWIGSTERYSLMTPEGPLSWAVGEQLPQGPVLAAETVTVALELASSDLDRPVEVYAREVVTREQAERILGSRR